MANWMSERTAEEAQHRRGNRLLARSRAARNFAFRKRQLNAANLRSRDEVCSKAEDQEIWDLEKISTFPIATEAVDGMASIEKGYNN